MFGLGSAGMVWTGMMWQVELRLGMAGTVGYVEDRYVQESCGLAGEVGQGVSGQCAVC